MHGLLGLSLPDGDPYKVPGVPRETVKAWIVAALGLGVALREWPRRMLGNPKDVRRGRLDEFDAEEVGRAICARFPFMSAPTEEVVEQGGLIARAHLGRPRDLLSLRLQNIEARALTAARLLLKGTPDDGLARTLALPLHDSLIVPASMQREADQLIKGAFAYDAKVAIRMTTEVAPPRDRQP